MRPLIFSRPCRFFSPLPAGLVLALALCAHRVEQGRAATHDLARDFSIATNPNGVWSYGWLSDFGGPFTPMDTPRADELPSIPIWSWSVGGFSPPDAHFNAGTNTFTGDGGTFPPGSLWVCPGPEGTPRHFGVMRFTVPVNGAGNYRIAVEAEPYLGELSGDTDFHITRNGEALLSQSLTPRGRASYLDVLALAAGDTIDLMVGRGPDGALHGSCLKLQAELSRLDEPPPPPPPGTNCVPIVPGLAGWWPGDGNASDLIGGHHGVVQGGAGFASGKIGPAFAFNGSNSSVRIPASPALDVGADAGLTVECWINPADLAVRSPLVEWNRNGPGIITWGVHLYILRPDEFGLGAGNLVANLSEPSGVSHLIFAPGGTVAANTWQHVALTYDKTAGQARLYRDGQLVAASSVGSFTPETSYDLYFGRRPSGDAVLSYRGLLDDVGIYNRALSANEIQRIVQASAAGKCSTNVPPPPPPVQAFDLSRDYSLASNPNGPWTYGYLTDLDGSFGPLAASRTFSADNGVPIAAWELNTYQLPGVWKVLGPDIAHSDGEHFTAEPGTIYFAPGADTAPQNFGAIRFTVPPGAGGPYRILTSVRSLFDAGRSRDADFHVLKNRQELFSRFLPPNSATSYSNVLTLAAGDHIDFAIGRGADGLTADTGLKIQASLTPLLPVTNPPPPAPFYDVAADYSTVNNPNGPWSYGWKAAVSGEFSRINFAKHFFAENGVPIFTWLLSDTQQPSVSYVVGPGTAISAAGQFVAEPGTLYFTAGDDNTRQNFGAVRFTVPSGQGGRFRLETSVRDLFDGFYQGDTDFHVVRNGQELFGRSLPVHATAGYTNVLELAGGDVIDFLIGRGEDGHQAGSGLKLLARLTPATNAPPPPPGDVFDLSRDYSIASNPNGPWTYGYLTMLNGAFGPLAATRTFDADNGVPIAAWELDTYQIPGVWKVMGPGVAHSDGDHFTADPGTVYFAPGADGAPQNFGAIRFTVPTSGQYRVETRVRSLFDGGRSRDADFHVLKNGQELYGEFLPPNTATTYSNVLGVVAGDRIDFAIGPGLDGLTADTGLKIQATLTLLTHAPPDGTNCVPAPAGLVAWWPFDGDGRDIRGSSPAAVEGDAGFGAGRVAGALHYDGVNDFAHASSSTSLNVGAGAGLTIEGWINPSDLSHLRPLVEWNDGVGGIGVHFWVGVDTATSGDGHGNLFANLVDVNGMSHQVWTPANVIAPGTWQHVALTYNKASGDAAIFRNGVLLGHAQLGSFTPQTAQPLYFGLRPSGPFSGIYFAGEQDEISLYDRALSDHEIAAIHASAAAGKCPTSAPPPPSHPPVILNQPQSQTVLAGGLATFSVTATGAPPLGYRWRRNGATVPGATGPTLVLQNVGTTNQGLYSVVVTNAFGFAASSNAVLTVIGSSNSAPTITLQPTNVTMNAGGMAVFRVMATGGAPLFYRWFFIGTNPVLRGSSSTLVLSNVSLGQAGGYFAVVSNAFGAITSAVAQLTVLELPPPPANNLRLVAFTNAWRYDQSGADLGDAWRNPAYNDSAWPLGVGAFGFEAAPLPVPILTPLSLSNITYYFRTHFNFAGNPAGAGLVASNLIDDGAVFYLNGTEVGRLRVPEGQTAQTLALNQPEEGQFEVLNFPASALRLGDNVLAVEVHQSSIVSSDIVFGLSLHATVENPPPPPNPPVILSQPQSRTVFAGSSAAFSVNATGAPPLGFTWRRNGQTILAPNSPFLTLSNVTIASQGFYSVLVTNAQGSVLSSNATLTVLLPSNSPPTIFSITPSNRTVMAGTNVTISITATGAPPLTYQWMINSEDLAGRTNRVLSLAAVQPSNTGVYRCVVSNPFGSVTSAPSVLTVIDPFPPTNQPPNVLATLEPSFDLSSETTNRFVICGDGIAARIVVDASFCSDPDGDSLQLFCVEDDLVMPFPPHGRMTNEFTLGTHTLAVLADDGRASATQTLRFDVLTAGEAVGELAALVETSSLPRRTKRVLLATLAVSGAGYNRGDGALGRRALDAFCAKVRSQVSSVSSAEADRLITAGQRLLRAVGP